MGEGKHTLADLERRIAELEAESAELTKALTGLTCGGSEFFLRKGNRYVADIPACVAWVERRDRDAHNRYLIERQKASAAPEMKEALTDLLVELSRSSRPSFALQQRLEAALAKANGTRPPLPPTARCE